MAEQLEIGEGDRHVVDMEAADPKPPGHRIFRENTIAGDSDQFQHADIAEAAAGLETAAQCHISDRLLGAGIDDHPDSLPVDGGVGQD